MVVGAIGQSLVNVTRPVVGEGNTGTAPAPTRPPLRTERSAEENLRRARGVKASHAQV